MKLDDAHEMFVTEARGARSVGVAADVQDGAVDPQQGELPRTQWRFPQSRPAVSREQVDLFAHVDGSRAHTDCWHISLRFGLGVLRDGVNPLSFIRHLETMGRITGIATLSDPLPNPDEIGEDDVYCRGFEIAFQSKVDKAKIESVFDFVREDFRLLILPPHSLISEYVHLLQVHPGDSDRLGDMLVRCGTLTSQELDTALHTQSKNPDLQIGAILVQQGSVHPEVISAALSKQQQVKDEGLRLSARQAQFLSSIESFLSSEEELDAQAVANDAILSARFGGLLQPQDAAVHSAAVHASALSHAEPEQQVKALAAVFPRSEADVAAMVSGQDLVSSTMETMLAKMEGLGSFIDELHSMVADISRIAQQSNQMAIHAGMAAMSAGSSVDYGRGFSMPPGEFRMRYASSGVSGRL